MRKHGFPSSVSAEPAAREMPAGSSTSSTPHHTNLPAIKSTCFSHVCHGSILYTSTGPAPRQLDCNIPSNNNGAEPTRKACARFFRGRLVRTCPRGFTKNTLFCRLLKWKCHTYQMFPATAAGAPIIAWRCKRVRARRGWYDRERPIPAERRCPARGRVCVTRYVILSTTTIVFCIILHCHSGRQRQPSA